MACRVRGRQDRVLVCEECDTVWEGGAAPRGTPPYVILEEYLARFGLPGLWSELEWLEAAPLPEAIGQLAARYFHQDYDLDSGTPGQAVESFRDEEPPEAVAALRAAVTELLAAGLSERELARLWLGQAGAAYDPRDEGIAMARWFAMVLEVTAEK
ncbi:contact-dependent growth inhibition system immunity protein [Streptomyces aquilus]|uniref:contact-dependent growth inhibition system immunity protein n=1 Tax=Streptomyces aquilus TaxID=2548456 RepID=UPI003695B698